MLTEAEYRHQCRMAEEKRRRAERATRGEAEPEKGYDAPVPAKLSAFKKLERANANFLERDKFVEPPLTDAERGMSPAAFTALTPQQRMAIWDSAMFERRKSR